MFWASSFFRPPYRSVDKVQMGAGGKRGEREGITPGQQRTAERTRPVDQVNRRTNVSFLQLPGRGALARSALLHSDAREAGVLIPPRQWLCAFAKLRLTCP